MRHNYYYEDNRTIYIQNIMNYDNVCLYNDWQGREDINMLPGKTLFLGVSVKKPITGKFYCGCITVGTPEFVSLEEIREHLLTIKFNLTDNCFSFTDRTGHEYRYEFT